MRNVKTVIVGILFLALIACNKEKQEATLFSLIPSEHSNVDFNNVITDNDSFNILKYEYIYNGGGVALADFNNDGLSDIFFSGNMVSNRLYLNKGDFQFEDVTDLSNIGNPESWCSGIAVVDINQDGYKDIYVSTNTKKKGSERKNLLFVNQSSEFGKIVFKEMAQEYGIADSSYTTNSAFFDYDNDGDLDLFIINNHLSKKRHAITYSFQSEKLIWDRVDRLYRNDWSDTLGHPFYTDVTAESGINVEGYSLGLNICDINEDGWKDIYITNDFITSDILYINNQDGTFTNHEKDYLKHTSHSAMGNDIADINNDGLMDIITVDMLPESNYRKKTMMPATSYTKYVYNQNFGYSEQYVRNVLQLNQGKTPYSDDYVFSEVAMMAGIEATDWSWTPLLADFDLDGHRDLIITNGFPKDITDKDFIEYQSNFGGYVETKKILSKIPEVKLPNYAYRNNEDVSFEDVTRNWGMNTPSFSNGAAYGDLDNDGDLDIVINNINDPAFIYKNNAIAHNSLSIRLTGTHQNPAALGSIIKYESENINGIHEHTLSRGYLSSMDEKIIIGLGPDSIVNVTVIWPNGKISEIENHKTGQNLLLNVSDAKSKENPIVENNTVHLFNKNNFFSNHVDKEIDHIDYNIEPLLLRKMSQNGPGIAVGDVNGDDRDDYYVTGSYTKSGALYIQDAFGNFKKMEELPISNIPEEQSALFFDADNDGDQDLYIANGSNHFEIDHELYKDVLLINENGTFQNESINLDLPIAASSCVRAADFDKDGDLDLFVGGRLSPGNYPMSVSSYLLINESGNGVISFTQSEAKNSSMIDMGMVTDALWTDYDNDGWQDLIVVGEWMPITLFHNNKGQLEKVEDQNILDNKIGWWNSIGAGDFDNDGDIDYVVGNYGLNSTIWADNKYPFEIFAKDFDENGSLDALPFGYFKDLNGQLQKYPFHERGDLSKEMNKIKKSFTSHHNLGMVTIDSILSQKEQSEAFHLRANSFASAYIENTGNGKFSLSELPRETQLSSIFGLVTEDYDNDGFLDILAVGNDFGAQPWIGRMDAFNGLYLKGNGKGEFDPITIEKSGFYVPTDAKALVHINSNKKRSVLASQNQSPLLSFSIEDKWNYFTPHWDDVKISYSYRNEKITKEIYYGNGYLSQSSRKMAIPKGVSEIKVKNNEDQTRTQNIQ